MKSRREVNSDVMLLSRLSCPALVLVLAIGCAAQNIQKRMALNSCSRIFGATIDPQLNLFVVDSNFVLQPRFDSAGNLTVLSVLPKYYFAEQHPEWTEPPHWPLFSNAEYRTLLARVDGVAPKGKLIASYSGGAVTNSTAYPPDRYERALVIRGEVVDRIRFFHIYPAHQIQARVRKSRHYQFFSLDIYQVLIGDLIYFIEAADYRRLKRGSTQTLTVVGPVKGFCFAHFCNP